MGTLLVGGQTFTIYGTSAGANTYYLTVLGPTRTKWDASSPDEQASALVSATRLLDRQKYNSLANTQSLRLGLALFETACYELAGMLLVNPGLMTQTTSGSNVKRAKSGDDEVEFFEPTLYETGRFPINIMELIGDYLGSDDNTPMVSGSFASGTNVCPDPSADPDYTGIVGGS